MGKLDCCVQGQGHSKISKCPWMFVQMISAEMLNLFLPGLVWWCSIMSQIVFQKDWFAVFKITITDMIKLWLFNILSELLILLQLNLVWWHIIIKWRLDCSVVVKVEVTEEVQNSSECSSGRYLLSCWSSVTKLGMVMQHHGPKVSCKKICLLSSRSWSQGRIV